MPSRILPSIHEDGAQSEICGGGEPQIESRCTLEFFYLQFIFITLLSFTYKSTRASLPFLKFLPLRLLRSPSVATAICSKGLRLKFIEPPSAELSFN